MVAVVVILDTIGKAFLSVPAVGAIQAKFLNCKGVTACVVPVPVCACALVANGLPISHKVWSVALQNTLLADTSANDNLSHVAGVIVVILLGLSVAAVGINVAHDHQVAVLASVSACVAISTNHFVVVLASDDDVLVDHAPLI